MSSVAGVVRVATSSAATSATTLSAKRASVETSDARSSPLSSMQVVHNSTEQAVLIRVQNSGCACCFSFLYKCIIVHLTRGPPKAEVLLLAETESRPKVM